MKTRNLMKGSLVVCLVATLAYGQSTKLESVSKILDQPNSPIKILTYKSAYGMHSKVALVGEKTEGVRHQAEYQNVSERGILAVQLGYFMFDLFNEYLGDAGTIEMDLLKPGDKDKSDGVASYGATFLTGVAFVSKVRFADGEVWRANLDNIAQELAKIDKEFEISALKRKAGSEEKQN